MEQIKKPEDLLGKTIVNYIMPKSAVYGMWLRFENEEFAVFRTENIGSGFNRQEVIVLEDYEMDSTHSELVELGLITKDEHEKAVIQEELEYEQKRKQREDEEKKLIESKEKETLEILKKKYGQ